MGYICQPTRSVSMDESVPEEPLPEEKEMLKNQQAIAITLKL